MLYIDPSLKNFPTGINNCSVDLGTNHKADNPELSEQCINTMAKRDSMEYRAG